jgi:signal transduction histidine kinase
MTNHVSNAVQAMPEGGICAISAWNIAIDKYSVISGLKEGTYTVLSIKDTGTGIKPENLHNIFKHHYSTRQGGSGIGLTLCKYLIETNGGAITVESEPGRGTTFTLYLPS